jgi:LmbE family N-acetylglucosaminyl deacetylase
LKDQVVFLVSGKIIPMHTNAYIPKCVLSIHAHPDDQEFTVAGTLALWSRNNCRVISVIVTSGESGCNDPGINSEYKSQLGALREKEQTAACSVLGINEVSFLHYPDGEVEPSMQLRHDLTRLIRIHKPNVIVIGDPTRIFYGNEYINHPDHRAVAQASLYAAFPSAGSRLIFVNLLKEGLEPHNIQKIYLHGSENPDTWVDISTTIDKKICALKEHHSQLADWDPEETIRAWAAEEGNKQGMEYAEAFKVMVVNQN